MVVHTRSLEAKRAMVKSAAARIPEMAAVPAAARRAWCTCTAQKKCIHCARGHGPERERAPGPKRAREHEGERGRRGDVLIEWMIERQ